MSLGVVSTARDPTAYRVRSQACRLARSASAAAEESRCQKWKSNQHCNADAGLSGDVPELRTIVDSDSGPDS